MKTWYTQPKNSFASFYYYQPDTQELIRIRMELGRGASNGDDGSTRVIYKKKRYVGFSPDSTVDRKTLRVEGGKIQGLSAEPAEGQHVYDFTSTNGQTPDQTPHLGNKVTSQPRLPDGVDEAVLINVAEKALEDQQRIILTPAGADAAELSKKLKELAQ